MANTRRYIQLITRTAFLEKKLLPKVKISGNYTKQESDLIRSYILLVHAEIESYFEDIARDKAIKALYQWDASRTKSHCLLSIMTFRANDITSYRDNQKHSLESRVKRVVNHYVNSLNSNHGIKSNNIFDILLPIGVEENQFDSAWLSIMDNFGTTRGNIAHTTCAVQSQIDVVTEKNRINNQIMPEIKRLDELIKKII